MIVEATKEFGHHSAGGTVDLITSPDLPQLSSCGFWLLSHGASWGIVEKKMAKKW